MILRGLVPSELLVEIPRPRNGGDAQRQAFGHDTGAVRRVLRRSPHLSDSSSDMAQNFLRLSLKNFQRSFPSPSRLSRCSARQRSKSAHLVKLGSPSVFLLRHRPSVSLLSTPLEFLSLSLLRCTSRSCPGRDGTVACQRRTRARDITGTQRQ